MMLITEQFEVIISIHAPTRGATAAPCVLQCSFDISIHAPTRGATDPGRLLLLPLLYFNPRSHEGSDRNSVVFHFGVKISIHAPTRGATKQIPCDRIIYEISIHAPTRGATTEPEVLSGNRFIFQSTLPRGERPDTSG